MEVSVYQNLDLMETENAKSSTDEKPLHYNIFLRVLINEVEDIGSIEQSGKVRDKQPSLY